MTRPLFFFTVWNYNLASPLITLQKCQNIGGGVPQSGHGSRLATLTYCCFVLGKGTRAVGWTSVGFSVLFISVIVFHFLCWKASIPFGISGFFLIFLFCFLNIFFWTICYTFHNQTMLKFYFNTMTKTRFTLKYSRIHSAQACGSKEEWKTKAKFLYKGLAFPFPPSHPLKVSVFPPTLGFWSRKVLL